IFHLPKEGKLAVFDVNEARVVKNLAVGDDKVFFAAGMTKLLVVLTEKNVLQRWSLLTFERELTVPLPVKGVVGSVAMGSAAGDAVPGPDGKTVFTSAGLFTARLKKVTAERRNGTPLPALQGEMYVSVIPADPSAANKNASLSFHLPGDGRALFTLTHVDGL